MLNIKDTANVVKKARGLSVRYRLLLFVVAIVAILMFTGCAMIKVNPENNQVTYFRMGDQKLTNLTVKKTKDGLVIRLIGQESEGKASDAVEAIGTVVSAVK